LRSGVNWVQFLTLETMPLLALSKMGETNTPKSKALLSKPLYGQWECKKALVIFFHLMKVLVNQNKSCSMSTKSGLKTLLK
jgi:hypothetical protein